jgi:hypothetical protein
MLYSGHEVNNNLQSIDQYKLVTKVISNQMKNSNLSKVKKMKNGRKTDLSIRFILC